MALLSRISGQIDDRSARLAGIALMLLGVGLFSLGDAVGKMIVASYALGQLLLLRSITSLTLMLPFIWRERETFRNLQRPGLHAMRVALSTIEVAAFFLAVTYLPLADVITYYLATPIFVTALSAVFLKEHVGWRRWSAVAVGFAGVLIALQPSSDTLSWPALIALGGSFSFAVLMVVTRSLRGASDVVLASSQFCGTLLFGLVLAPFGWVSPSWSGLSLFILAGFISVGALLSVNRSLKLAPASVVVPYQYTMIIWAVLFGYLVFGDVPELSTLIGAAIIIAAGFYIFLREQKLGRPSEGVNPPPA
ncbi:MAG TPA: DMT family transporter [Xanthobacteraceae bacterium]|nr:DMT family transporter [Xanthobacteraceae bacterium]HWW49349.1 DMT family transporter [Xanthobacteraceae bacterium]